MFKLIAKSHNSNYGKGYRNHNQIRECNFTITIFLKSFLVKAFPHNHFHEGGNLMTLRFKRCICSYPCEFVKTKVYDKFKLIWIELS